MSLNPNCINWGTFFPQLFDNLYHSVASPLLVKVIVVVNQQCLGIELVCVPKCFGDEVVAEQFSPNGIAEILVSTAADCLVNYIPRLHTPLISFDHRFDVRFHTLHEHMWANLAVSFSKEPRRSPIIFGPDQAMPKHLQIIVLRKLNDLICLAKLKNAFTRLNRREFHTIFRGNVVEVINDKRFILIRFHRFQSNAHTNIKASTDGFL